MKLKKKFNEVNENSTTSYTNTEFFLASLIKSIDNIERDEINALSDPQEYMFSYYARVNALYSKMGFFVVDNFIKDNKTINVPIELNAIKKRLYNKQFVNDIKKFNKLNSNNNNEDNLVKEYNNIIMRTTEVYRHMITEFSRKGMFFQINEKQTVSGLVR